MKTRVARLATGVVCLISLSAQAESFWVKVTESASGTVFSIDTESIEAVGGTNEYKKFWIKGDATSTRPQERWSSSMSQYIINCKYKTITTLSATQYDKAGNVHWQLSSPLPYSTIIPESVASGYFDAVCGSAR